MRSVVVRGAVRAGAVAGITVWYLALVGIIERLADLAIIGGFLTMDQLLIFLPAALAGQRQAHQAARVRDHEVDVGRAHQLGGHDQVAFVLAVLVVDDHDHAAGADFVEQFGDGCK